MNAVQTAASGVVDASTVFEFHQTGNRVHARYSGGKVERGCLVGRVHRDELRFRYFQIHTNGSKDGGLSVCELCRNDDNLLQIIEHFEWDAGKGTNVLREIRHEQDQ